MFNNIVSVQAGVGLSVADNSQVGFQSNYNCFQVAAGPSANLGFWNGATRKTLALWQAASTRDINSLEGDPGFVDLNGADNILGYVVTASGAVNGGIDDNFYRAGNSPATDRGNSWLGTAADIEGFSVADDPGAPNQGSLRYVQDTQAPTLFGPAALGVAQNWHGDNQAWLLSLTFNFSYFGTSYNSVWVSSNGLLQFGDGAGAEAVDNSNADLLSKPRIAPLWDDLSTLGSG